MTSPRARWLAARTRNAARHGLIIAGAGVIVMIATLLTFVLLPRQADRALSNAVAALPPPRDTLVLRAQRVRADSQRLQAEALRATARIAVAATLSGTGTAADSLLAAAMLPVLGRDTLLRDLAGHLARARQAPLVESYRALAEAPVLAGDPALRSVLRRIRDSIEVLNREREASAALSGPDARYAALTAMLTEQGGQLVTIADRVLRARSVPVVPPDSSVPPAADTVPATVTSMPPALMPPALMPPALMPDSLLDVAVREATDSVARVDSLLAVARRFNAELDQGKASLRARMQVHVPPVAMLLASLVLGVTMGFAVSLWREVRRPTVGDAQELEELTRSRVIVHHGDDGVRVGGGFTPHFGARMVSRLGRRSRRGEAQAPVLTPAADAWPLLHLTLSNIGDMARQVLVMADRPVVAGAVGLNLASVAARESRATVLVDAALRAGAVVPLLPATALERSDRAPVVPVVNGEPDRQWESAWDASRALPLGRDASVTLVLPRRARSDAGARGRPRTEGQSPALLDPLLRRFDFVVFVADAANVAVVPESAELVLCARLGTTPLAWIASAVRTADEHGRRIRAVVLWADDVPLAGSRASG